MPEEIQDALDYLITADGCFAESCDCGSVVVSVDNDFVEAAKDLAMWVEENCK